MKHQNRTSNPVVFGRLKAQPTRTEYSSRTAAPRVEDYRYRSEGEAAVMDYEITEASAPRFVAKFNWLLNLVAGFILIVSMSWFLNALSSLPGGQLVFSKGVEFSFIGDLLASGVGFLIGSVWLAKGVLGAEALIITDTQISGFTLLGTKTIPWQDVSHFEVGIDRSYGRNIQIHAKKSSPSGSFWLNTIPLYVDLTDKSIDEVLAALRLHRPDVLQSSQAHHVVGF